MSTNTNSKTLNPGKGATNKQGHEWNGERNGVWWMYADDRGNLYESKEVPCIRIRLNATQVVCADGKLAIAPINPK